MYAPATALPCGPWQAAHTCMRAAMVSGTVAANAVCVIAAEVKNANNPAAKARAAAATNAATVAGNVSHATAFIAFAPLVICADTL
jgi:hypothetical protein